MSLVLHDNPASSNALKARFALAELALEAELRTVRLTHPRPDWHRALQPGGTVPLLIDGERLVGESNAILRYLAARERRDDLYPADLAARSQVDWALDLWSTRVRPALFTLERLVLFAAGPVDQDAVAAATPGVARALDAWERFTGDRWTVLDRLTIADMCVAPALWRSARLPLDLDRQPKTAALRAALAAHPAFVAAGPVA
jgi:glutathione S-transferase